MQCATNDDPLTLCGNVWLLLLQNVATSTVRTEENSIIALKQKTTSLLQNRWNRNDYWLNYFKMRSSSRGRMLWNDVQTKTQIAIRSNSNRPLSLCVHVHESVYVCVNVCVCVSMWAQNAGKIKLQAKHSDCWGEEGDDNDHTNVHWWPDQRWWWWHTIPEFSLQFSLC